MTYISWPDLLAYADWAALRPITELEYEKAARGVDVQVHLAVLHGVPQMDPLMLIVTV